MRRYLQFDDFLPNPEAARLEALASEFKDVEHRGLSYPGIALAPDLAVEEKIRELLGVKGGAFTSFYRRYLPEEKAVTFIHNDCQIGTLSGILFLTLPEHCKGGLAFWRHRLYGWEAQPPSAEAIAHLGLKDTPALWEGVHQDGFDEERWQMVDYVPMEFNRLVLFQSVRYHSRYPQEPIGSGPENCRLIKTFFYKPEKAEDDAA